LKKRSTLKKRWAGVIVVNLKFVGLAPRQIGRHSTDKIEMLISLTQIAFLPEHLSQSFDCVEPLTPRKFFLKMTTYKTAK
jgi:hypothetical protein